MIGTPPHARFALGSFIRSIRIGLHGSFLSFLFIYGVDASIRDFLSFMVALIAFVSVARLRIFSPLTDAK